MKTNRARYQNGSIRKVKRAKGYAWEVRYSEIKDSKRHQRTEIYDDVLYRTEKDVRKATELTVSQINSGTAGARTDAKFGTIITLYGTEHLPTLQYASRKSSLYLLRDYIEDRFAQTPLTALQIRANNSPLGAAGFGRTAPNQSTT
jgi:hypothetical protein